MLVDAFEAVVASVVPSPRIFEIALDVAVVLARGTGGALFVLRDGALHHLVSTLSPAGHEHARALAATCSMPEGRPAWMVSGDRLQIEAGSEPPSVVFFLCMPLRSPAGELAGLLYVQAPDDITHARQILVERCARVIERLLWPSDEAAPAAPEGQIRQGEAMDAVALTEPRVAMGLPGVPRRKDGGPR